MHGAIEQSCVIKEHVAISNLTFLILTYRCYKFAILRERDLSN